jgi:hypothetical protein
MPALEMRTAVTSFSPKALDQLAARASATLPLPELVRAALTSLGVVVLGGLAALRIANDQGSLETLEAECGPDTETDAFAELLSLVEQ